MAYPIKPYQAARCCFSAYINLQVIAVIPESGRKDSNVPHAPHTTHWFSDVEGGDSVLTQNPAALFFLPSFDNIPLRTSRSPNTPLSI